METPPNSVNERSVSALLADLRGGGIDITEVSAADRRACVGHLTIEGLTAVEIASVLGISDRTVVRDRAANRKDERLRAEPELVEQLAGELYRMAEISIDHIRRDVRDRDTPPAVRVAARHRCFRIQCELIKVLQSIGYLPTATTKVSADLTHRPAEPMRTDAVRAELERIRGIALDANCDEKTQEEFQTYEYAITTLCDLMDRGQSDDHA